MTLRRALRAARTALLGLAVAAPAAAFHEQGVSTCDGCHVMHDSQDGLRVATDPAGGEVLLTGESPSDVCLTCHADSLGAVLGADPLNPPPEKGGGNFVFLVEDNLNDAPGGALDPIPGDAAGHNIVAPGHGLFADGRHSLAPGGTFPAGELGCTSCHDPHGNKGFRFLHGTGQVQGGTATFNFPAPQAVGIGLGAGAESPANHTAYRQGMSDWCANCHGRYHEGGLSAFEHPGDESLGGDERDRYNAYNGDDDPAGGSPALAYLPEVPFEDPAATTGSQGGPAGGSRVMCLTCHRAHATSAPAAGRWDFNLTLLRDDGAASGSYPIPDPYRSPNQGTLCSKCHEGGAPSGPGGLPKIEPPPG